MLSTVPTSAFDATMIEAHLQLQKKSPPCTHLTIHQPLVMRTPALVSQSVQYHKLFLYKNFTEVIKILLNILCFFPRTKHIPDPWLSQNVAWA
jgi:hypothetical protein